MFFSKLALSTTGRSKRTTTGMPTPTLPPSRGGDRDVDLVVEGEVGRPEGAGLLGRRAVGALGLEGQGVLDAGLEQVAGRPGAALEGAVDLDGVALLAAVGQGRLLERALLGRGGDAGVDGDVGRVVVRRGLPRPRARPSGSATWAPGLGGAGRRGAGCSRSRRRVAVGVGRGVAGGHGQHGHEGQAGDDGVTDGGLHAAIPSVTRVAALRAGGEVVDESVGTRYQCHR